jgi:hypothetical protein
MYTKPEELGWDPTITRQRIQGHTCYDITVDAFEGERVVPVVFRTEQILSDFAADALRSRDTRVFKARKLNPVSGQVEGEPVAIKDVWVDDDRDREGWIRAKIEEGANEEDKLLIQQYFMTVLHHGDVIIFGQTDHTWNLIMRQADVPSEVRFPLRRNLDSDRPEPVPSSGSTPFIHIPGLTCAPHAEYYQYHAKVHYRVVYREVAQALHDVQSFAVGFQALIDGTEGKSNFVPFMAVH